MKKDEKNTNKNEEMVNPSEETMNTSEENLEEVQEEEVVEEKKPRKIKKIFKIVGAAIGVVALGAVACLVAGLRSDNDSDSNEYTDIPQIEKDDDKDEEEA